MFKILKGDKHNCGYTQCSRCKESIELGDNQHLCYMQPLDEEKQSKKEYKTWIFFDFETRQDLEISENAYGAICKHEINCCVVQKVCHGCRKNEKLGTCPNCGPNELVFKGDTAGHDFCKWLFTPCNKGAVAIAHNMRGFDGQFILDYCHKNVLKPEICPRGLSLLSLEVK